jgi:polyisoprenyl-phosphate glycosyltransferase
MQHLSAKYSHIKSIRLSKNFGQYPATMAGLQHASGDWIVVIDCDLQDRPEEIPGMFKKAMEGFDSVIAVRADRKDSYLRKMASSSFSKIFNFLTGTNRNAKATNFGVYHQKVIKALLSHGDMIKFFPLFINWVGFKQYFYEVEHAERSAGSSGYNWSKLINLAISTILTFSNRPLRLIANFGMIISFISFILGINYLIKYFMGWINVAGYTSLILTICFFSGIIITTLGIIGMYIGKIFEQTKNRPEYIVDTKLNLK